MKRILSVTLAFVLMLSCFCLAYANDDVWEKNMETRCKVLEGLRIINSRADGTYQSDRAILNDRTLGDYSLFRNISKSAFINYICNFYADYGYSDDYSQDAIRTAEKMGIIYKGQTDLNKPLYFDEAITMLVRLLGYEYHANLAGGFPSGYVAIAGRLGLTDGLSAKSGERLQEFDAITLLYNAINTAYVEITGFSDTGITYGNASENTFLYEFRKIYRVDGVLEGTETSAVTTAHTVSKGYVMINGYQYQTEEDYYGWLGMNVEAYIHDDKDGNPVVLCAVPSRNEELVIPVKDIESLSGDITKLEYVDANDREKNITISPIVNVIYNGQPVDTYTRNDFLNADGILRLINNDSDREFEVVFIEDYKTVVIDSISQLNETIKNLYTYDTENLTLNMEEEYDEVVSIIGEDGELVVSELLPGDVLRVAKSKAGGKKMILAYLSRAQVSGTVTALHSKEETVVTLEQTEYLLSKAFEDALDKNDPKAKPIQVGRSYTFYLDSEGKIAYVKDVDDGLRYGLVKAMASDGVFTTKHMLKLFTADGLWKELPVAERIVLNDSSGQYKGKTDATVLGRIPTVDLTAGGLIGYTTNADGEINRIDVPVVYNEVTGNDGQLNYKDFSLSYYSGNSAFDSEIFLGDNPVVWRVPADKTEEEAYSISNKNLFEDKRKYLGYAYQLDEFGLTNLLVIESSGNEDDDVIESDNFLVVEDMIESMDSEGNQVQMISGMRGTYDALSFYCHENMVIVDQDDNVISDPLVRGDVVSLSADSMGYVKKVKRYTSVANREREIISHENLRDIAAIVQGRVYDIDAEKGMMKLRFTGDVFKRIRINSVNVIIYNLERNKIFRGTIQDIEEGNIIVTKLQYSRAYTLVVFQ